METLKFHNQEFEKAARLDLFIYNAPITAADALTIDEVDCSDFMFDPADAETLCAFKNLRWLELHINFKDLSFLKELKQLFNVIIHLHGVNLNVNDLISLNQLETLLICGETKEKLCIENLESVSGFPHLKTLIFSEFQSIDLSRVEHCQNFTGISFDKIDVIENLASFEKMKTLERITFTNLTLPNLDFLDHFENDLHLTAHNVNVLTDFDVSKLDRFKKMNVLNLKIKGKTVIERIFKGIAVDQTSSALTNLNISHS